MFQHTVLPMSRLFYSLLFVLVALSGIAQVPQTLSYQGLLTDNTGSPVADGNYAVTFRFYTVPTAGIATTTRGPLTVTTFKGLFMATLGDGSSADNLALPYTLGNQEVYVGITISPSVTELTPRVRLTAVPYAYAAYTVTTVDASKVTGILPIANGGTGGALASDARTNLGLAIGTNVQAYDADLDDLADGSLSGNKVGAGIDAGNITTGTLSLVGTDAAKLPVGTSAQRPASPVAGQLRYNSSENTMEFFNGTNWYFLSPKVAVLKDVKNQGVHGGNTTPATWMTRDLNTVTGDNFVTLSANTFTLPPGEYIIEATAPAYQVDSHRIRLFDNTNNTDNINGANDFGNTYGSTEYNTTSGTGSITHSTLYARITVSAATGFRIQQFTGQALAITNGLGLASNLNRNEIYSQVIITKLR